MLAWVKTACWVSAQDWPTFEEIWIFLAFSIFQIDFSKYAATVCGPHADSYNEREARGSTILEKKGWDSLSNLVQKVSPFPLMQRWSQSCCQRPRRVAQHWLMGVGKDMTNGELDGFFKTMHCPKCPNNRKHWDNCNKVGQVSQLFFSRIVESKLSC